MFELYFAHSNPEKDLSTWQPLNEHLRAVAQLSERFAREALPNNTELASEAFHAGLLHDLGKYRPEFQKMIRGLPVQKEKTYHKQAGAALLKDLSRIAAAFAVLGHHGGMPNYQSMESKSKTAKRMLQGADGEKLIPTIRDAYTHDCPEISALRRETTEWITKENADLWTRVVFSCLVDADWTDTSAYYAKVNGLPVEPESPGFEVNVWLARLLSFIQGKATDCKDPRMAQIRGEILEACLSQAPLSPGLFSLTVPTGGGKTLSGMAFALKHAARHGLRRVIYVAPYLSIIEQNARVIREALGLKEDSMTLFEHHSLSDPPDKAIEAESDLNAALRAENWSSPLIVTTNVQFFESLFSNRPSRCRKLHNIARSVILLDECQSLPPGLLQPTCAMLKQLTEALGATVVFCTATQPALDHRELKEAALQTREIVPVDLDLFRRLQRVTLTWPTPRGTSPGLTWDEVAEEMSQRRAALCIVNTRKAALEVFRALQQRDIEGVFHLSTNMCPAHRMEILTEVRRRLSDDLPCHLVSTQLIEAGVDVDFPLVLREIGPLEGIIQAAGRCNREGLLNAPDGTPGGKVIVFRSIDDVAPPGWYKTGKEVVETAFLTSNREPRIDAPADIAEYYRWYYSQGELDENKIEDLRMNFSFADVGTKYRLLEETIAVVVGTWSHRRDQIQELLDELRVRPSRSAFRKLIPYQVNLRNYERDKHGNLSAQVDPRWDLLEWCGDYDEYVGVNPTNSNLLLVV